MATINVSRATRTLSSPGFLLSAVLIVLGVMLAQILTDYLRVNVFDIPFAGGDSVYAMVAALIAMAILPGQYGRPIALGSTATAVRVAADQFGIV